MSFQLGGGRMEEVEGKNHAPLPRRKLIDYLYRLIFYLVETFISMNVQRPIKSFIALPLAHPEFPMIYIHNRGSKELK